MKATKISVENLLHPKKLSNLKWLRREIKSDFSEFKKYKANRCAYTSKEQAEAEGFSEIDTITFEKRVNSIIKYILVEGVSQVASIKVCIFNGIIYIIDGQGRCEAVSRLNASIPDGYPKFELAVDVYETDNEEDLIKEIIAMNQHHRNWSLKDRIRAKAMLSSNADVREAYIVCENLVKDIYNETGEEINISSLYEFFWGASGRNEKITHCTFNDESYWNWGVSFIQHVFIPVIKNIVQNQDLTKNNRGTLLKKDFVRTYAKLFKKFETWYNDVSKISKTTNIEILRNELTEIVVNWANRINKKTIDQINVRSAATINNDFTKMLNHSFVASYTKNGKHISSFLTSKFIKEEE